MKTINYRFTTALLLSLSLGLGACGGATNSENNSSNTRNTIQRNLAFSTENNCENIQGYIQNFQSKVSLLNAQNPPPVFSGMDNTSPLPSASVATSEGISATPARAQESDLAQMDRERHILYRIQSEAPASDGSQALKLKIYKTQDSFELVNTTNLDFDARELIVFKANQKNYLVALGGLTETKMLLWDVENPSAPLQIRSEVLGGFFQDAHYLEDKQQIVWMSTSHFNSENTTATDCENTYLYKADTSDWIEAYSTLMSTKIAVLNLENIQNASEISQIISPSSRHQAYLNSNHLFITQGSFLKSEIYLFRFETENKITNLNLKDSYEVSGSIRDQFSMDERNGILRLFYNGTYNNDTQSNGNHLLLLNVSDGKITAKGHAGPFEALEQIDSATFTNELACAATSIQMHDPLTCYKTVNASQPELLGRLEFSGFTRNLQQIKPNLLFGIGSNGTRFVAHLIDISNPSSPQIADQLILEDTNSNFFSSPAINDYRAMGKSESGLIFSIPSNQRYSQEDTSEACNKQALVEINPSTKKLALKNNFYSSRDSSLEACSQHPQRGFFENDQFISLVNNGVEVFDLSDGNKTFEDLSAFWEPYLFWGM